MRNTLVSIIFTLFAVCFAEARVSNPIFYNPTSAVSATGTITTTSATDVLMTGMTLTPPLGTYQARCDSTFTSTSNNADVFLSIYVNGVQVPSSEKISTPQIQGGVTPSLNFDDPIGASAEVTVNGAQAIECRWRRTAGTAGSINRSLTVDRIR